MHPHVFFISSLVLLWLKATTATYLGHQLVAAAAGGGYVNGAINKCIDKERHALLDFKARLQDPHGQLLTWRPEDDCCKWSGITCNYETGHVTMLDLSHDVGDLGGVRGEISHSLLNLSYLSYLDLSYNSFHGTIPKFIGSMTRLTYLNLCVNNFSGTIPKAIGSLNELWFIDLSHNSFHGTIPPELGNLTNLTDLSIGPLVSYKIGNLDWLSHLSHLESLKMYEISLGKANHWLNLIQSLHSLLSLSLWGCNPSEVMRYPAYSSFVNSSSISFLSLRMYNLNSSMYRWLFPLTNNRLFYLDLSNNMLDGIPKYLGNLCGLTYLTLNDNFLAIKFSDFLKNLSGCTSVTLRHLYAQGNQLSGSLSDEIQNFSSLEHLDLSYNHLDGTISEKVWELTKLETLDVSSNSLRGGISENILQSKIGKIDLSNNSLELIPSKAHMSNISYVEYLDLSSNNFDGPIPNVPSTLAGLDLSKNKFYGGISFLCEIVDGFLSFLDLSHNSLTGQLPDCLWHFKELRVLNLEHNNLSGKLPASIGYLVRLEVLHLYNNNFSGELPFALKNCTELKFLNLGANKFFGNVPVWIGENLTGLYALSVRSNNFFGPIPLHLCYLMNLQILDLSMNNLNGTIPSCVNNLNAMVQGSFLLKQNIHHYLSTYKANGSSGTYVDNAMIEWQGNEHEFTTNLGSLMSIDLSSNNLTGQIPNELVGLHGLLALNLSKNTLLGEIPQKIGELKKLLTLDLSRNNFSGGIPSSMSQMTWLNYLDMSYNNLSGRIPSSTQLQSFEPSRYTGNEGLCGPPITKNCPGDEELEATPMGESEGGGEGIDELQRWFYIGGSTGFVIGFWIACGALLLNHHGRPAFFHVLDSVKDWVYVKVVVFIRKLQTTTHT